MSFQIKELNRDHFLEGMIRVGRIEKVDTTNRIVATVNYPDRGMQTGWLNVLQKNTVGTQEFYLPVKGEVVWVLHPANGPEKGLILGSVYTKKNPPPYNVQSIRGIVFGDGGYAIYDTAGSGNYQIHVPGGKITITTGGNVDATIGGNLTSTVSGNVDVEAGGTAKVKGSTITLQGNVVVTGTIDVKGSATFEVGGQTLAGHITNADGAGGGA